MVESRDLEPKTIRPYALTGTLIAEGRPAYLNVTLT